MLLRKIHILMKRDHSRRHAARRAKLRHAPLLAILSLHTYYTLLH